MFVTSFGEHASDPERVWRRVGQLTHFTRHAKLRRSPAPFSSQSFRLEFPTYKLILAATSIWEVSIQWPASEHFESRISDQTATNTVSRPFQYVV